MTRPGAELKSFRHDNFRFRYPDSWKDQSRLVLLASNAANLQLTKQFIGAKALSSHMAECAAAVERDLSSVNAKMKSSAGFRVNGCDAWECSFEFQSNEDTSAWIQVHIAIRNGGDLYVFIWTSPQARYEHERENLKDLISSFVIAPQD